MVLKDKTFYLLHSISEEPYIMTVIYVCKMIISSGFFSIFLKILVFWVHRGLKGQKTVQNDKKFVTLHIWGTIYHITVIYVCKMIISSVVFFSFSKFWFSGSIPPVEGQKTVQNDKKLCLMCSISQEPYIIWLSFMVQMCRMIISAGIFLNVKILIFQVIKGLKGQKMTKISVLHLLFQEPYIIWSSSMVHMNV